MTHAIQLNKAHAFQRSIHLEEDGQNKHALSNYVTVASPIRTLQETLTQTTNNSRAITWTGPYGGGKSALALILSAAFNPKSVLHEEAFRVLRKNPAVTKDIKRLTNNGAWIVVPMVAQNGSPQEQLKAQIVKSISERWGARLPVDLKKVIENTKSDILSILDVLDKTKSLKNAGILIVCDEMGRWLESAREHPATLDFLQEFAERINRANIKITFVGVLHQSFDQYAASQGISVRQNWSKVQGRYVDLPISLSPDESVSLVAAALQPQKKKHNAGLIKKTQQCWPQVDAKQMTSVLAQTWPLSPITAVLLGPVSKSQFGQNERTIFNFLSSHEPHALQVIFNDIEEKGGLYEPHHLWAYLDHNYHHLIRSSAISSQWNTISDAIDTVKSKGTEIQIQIAMAIGILNVFGGAANLSATLDVLKIIFSKLTGPALKKELEILAAWSVVVFRKYNQSWTIFEGSDLNISEEAAQIVVPASVELTHELNTINKPAVATRFYHQTGTLRWFPLEISSQVDVKKIGPNTISLVIPKSEADCVKAMKAAGALRKSKTTPFACGITPYDRDLIELLVYQYRLNEIKRENPTLRSDRIARRELEGQLLDNWQAIEARYWRLIKETKWYVSEVAKSTSLTLNQIATHLAQLSYPDSPYFHSEIVNRDKPSTNGMKARKELCRAMLADEALENLGIEGFPAERGLYINLLHLTGIHRIDESANRFRFGMPTKSKDSSNIAPAWRAIESFIKSSKSGMVSLEELDRELSQSPFGIKFGIRGILILAVLLSHQSNLVFYLDDEYVPVIDDLFVDQFLKNPGAIGVRYFELKGVARDSLEKIASLLKKKGFESVEIDPLPVARLLVAFAIKLPRWIRRTTKLSPTAKKVRDALLTSSDPYELIYERLPKAVSVELTDKVTKSKNPTTKFANRVASAVQELNSAYSRFLAELESLLCESLKIEREELAEVAKSAGSLKGLSGDLRLDSFIARVSEYENTEEWRESLLGLAANKAPRDWTDQEFDAAAFELTSMASRFSHLRLFQSSKNIKNQEKSLALVVGSGRYAESAIETITLSKQNEARVRPLVEEFHGMVKKNKLSKQQTLGLAATILEDLLITETET
ncbi:MAG: DUF6079 family protein [Pseudomonadota bacterium]